jgi:lysyl-tRNA synthetase class II
MSEELNEQQAIRREKLNKLREQGYPYPNDVCVTANSEQVKDMVKVCYG